MRRRIDEVARFTTQPREVAAFYAALLDAPLPGSERDAYTFDVEGVYLFIHRAGEGPTEPGWPDDVDHIAFEVDDVDADCARLRAAGHEILGPSDFPWGRSAYLRDPDGRVVELHAPGVAYPGGSGSSEG
jgi:catechol 2,3-dioxygenase-like lactoylglutathione lyase family enzyme